MKTINKLLGLGFLSSLVLLSCTKVELVVPQVIDMGKVSTSTAIKSAVQTNNNLAVVFETTPGAKYSVQIVPFGSEVPVRTEGFTAILEETKRNYNLSTLEKKDYDLIFIDIYGKEIKYPLIIK